MPDTFDPYLSWLGIEPEERPLDHYRLLGIERFESRREMVQAAADQRMGYIRSFQAGSQSKERISPNSRDNLVQVSPPSVLR